MADIVLTPEPEQKSYWRLIWTLIFVILMIPGVILWVFSEIIGGVIIYIVSVLAPLLLVLYWIPLYYRSMKFSITGEHVVVEKGVWWKKMSAKF